MFVIPRRRKYVWSTTRTIPRAWQDVKQHSL